MVTSQPGTYETLDFRESRPRRPLYLFFVRNLQIVVGVCVSAIVILSTIPYAPRAGIAAVAGYVAFRLIFVRRWLQAPKSGRTSPLQLVWRTMPLFVAVTALLLYLDWFTAYRIDHGQGTLWPLYLLIIIVVCQYGEEWMVVTYVIASAAALLVVYLGGPAGAQNRTSPDAWSTWFVVTIWLSLLALFYRLAARHIGEVLANLGLIAQLQREINSGAPFYYERDVLRLAVARMNESLRQSHVNVFRVEEDGSLCCMASAAAEGERRLEEGFTLGAGMGVLGKVVATRDIYVANDVAAEEEYVKIDIYEKTASELGAPIFDASPRLTSDLHQSDRQLIGVLDVQSDQRNAFLETDSHTAQILADLVGTAWTHCRLNDVALLRARAVDDAFFSLLGDDPGPQQIAYGARVSLDASLVVLFERDPRSGRYEVTALDGRVYSPALFRSSADHGFDLVRQILEGPDDAYFHESVQDLVDDPFWQELKADGEGAGRFFQREQIVSRSIFRLKAGNQVLGVLFVNYRERKRFTEHEKALQSRFALMAAIALRGRQEEQQRIESERTALASLLHDGPVNRASILVDLVSAVIDDDVWDDAAREKLVIALRAAEELKIDLRFLLGAWRGRPTTDLYLALERASGEARSAYGMDAQVHMEVQQVIVTATIVGELTLIINEAILNAHKHGEATRVNIYVAVADRDLSVAVEDNGKGAENVEVEGRGIENMKRRAAECGGRCVVTSDPGQGTRVQVTIPLAV